MLVLKELHIRKLAAKKNNVIENYPDSIVEEYRKILEATVDRMKNDVKVTPFQMLDFCDNDKLKILKVQKCVAMIEELINEL